ncbi:proton-coupled folate transporter-like [Portunus trituberculatus]|uniref:proton-coupled folate transporter-like n=1 Tax=Portunus trituberculatus TaxID=210409 RepID=UPI001E1D0C20|nr:proton-coupled folate transporter-like [Portunus trituberculatus]
MLLDGLAFSNMHVYIENLQMDRVCRVTCGFSEGVCQNLKAQHEASVEVQKSYSVFALYNGIIAAALPLFFILFMGAWSDKYGRKVPLVAVQVGHVLHAGGYLLASLVPSWPAEVLLLVTLLDTLGGGAVSFLTVANSYLGDVTPEESRTSRVGLANSIWFLGGPVGTLMGRYIYGAGGYLALFTTSLVLSVVAVVYVAVFLPESHGPFVKRSNTEEAMKATLELRDSVAAVYGLEGKKKVSHTLSDARPALATMAKDFFDPRRIVDSFKSTLRRREGNTRGLILTLIFTSLLRRVTRSPYVFAFTRHELGWEAADYSLWVTYKNLMATTGSLVAVPLLSGHLGVPDIVLALVGATSGILEYVIYGFVSQARPFLLWIGPLAALLLNSCTIAQRSMMTKFVANDEIGKVSAVLGALDGMMPMVNSALYTAVYHASVSLFPSAHFFLGAAASALMLVFFCALRWADKSGQYDVESAKVTPKKGPVSNKTLVMRTNSWWVTSDALALALSTGEHPTTLASRHARQELPQCQASQSMPPQHSLIREVLHEEPECQETVPQSQAAEPRHSRRRQVIQHLKSLIKSIAGPRRESSAEGNDNAPGKLTIANLFVNINSVASGVIFPKATQQQQQEEEKEEEEEAGDKKLPSDSKNTAGRSSAESCPV